MKPQKAPAVLHAPRSGDNENPFYFSDKPIGSRCLWAIRWVVGFDPDPKSMFPSKDHHVCELREWEPLGWELSNMTEEQIRQELGDVSARPNEFAPKAVKLLMDRYDDRAHWRYLAEELLFQARQGYPEAIAPWHEPKGIIHCRMTRPGWERWTGKEPTKEKGVRIGRK